MMYRTVPKTSDTLSILGFGCMRFPASNTGGVDEELAISHLRHAIDNGVNYIDTAPAYHMGKSEKIVGRALGDGYREKVRVATKLPPWSVHTHEDMDLILTSQCETLRTRYIDYYLLHSLTVSSWEKMKGLDVLSFLNRAKRDGRIVNAGFSFHGDIKTFKEIVDAYPWEFCQIQYNYLDEHNQAGTEGLRYASEKGLAVMIMEPLRGGNLVHKIPREVALIFENAPLRWTPAEWALRWVWDHPEVTVVLSGMNEYSQIDENIRIAGTSYPGMLSREERDTLSRVSDTYKRLMRVGCTGCGYCMPCPAGVDIPGCFAHYNEYILFNHDRTVLFHYFGRHGGLLSARSHAGMCTGCGRCEKRCPQQISVRDRLSDVSRDMERMMGVAIIVLKGGLWCLNRIGKIRRLFRTISGDGQSTPVKR